jgi:hypothetical protein
VIIIFLFFLVFFLFTPVFASPEALLPAASISTSDPQKNAEAAQKFIFDSYNSGAKIIRIPAGTYRLGTLPGDLACLHLKNLSDLEIDATGVIFLICGPKPTQSLELDDCRGFTLRGATFRHEIPPFSQGRIENIDSGRKFFDIRIAVGYPRDLDDSQRFFPPGAAKLINIYDASTRELKPRTNDLFFERFERLSPDLYRFRFSDPLPARFPLAVGDLAAWRGTIRADLMFIDCEKLRILSVNVESGSGFSLFEAGGEGGDLYQKCRIERGPPPDGATEPPLLSGCADGFHSESMRHGPTLEGCRFEHMGDDCIAIHGVACLVLKAEGNSVVIAEAPGAHPYYFRPGDNLQFYDDRGVVDLNATITGMTPVETYNPAPDFSRFNQFNLESQGGTLVYARLLLNKPVAAKFAWFAVNTSAESRGFSVRDCTVGNNRPRGMLIQTGDGIIENCLIEGSAIGGIIVQPDMIYWAEAGYAQNLILKHNTIKDVGIFNQIGAINVACWWNGLTPQFVPSPGGHRNIDIEDNIFENNDGLNILISSADHVVIKGNHFINPLQREKEALFGAPDGALGWITESTDITIGNNPITNPGPYMKEGLSTSSTVSGVTHLP